MISKFTQLSKKILLLFVFSILTFCLAVPSHAQSNPSTPSTGNNLFFGQQHAYSVYFRGNGEAVVFARVALKNMEDSVLQQFQFGLPDVTAAEMTAYQQVLPNQCIRYDYQNKEQVCLEYSEPDYFNYYGYSYPGNSSDQVTYNKLNVSQTGSVYSVNLTNNVAVGKSTALIIAYTTKSYVRDSLGLYKFKFETMQVNQRVSESRVAIDVEEELYLKDKKSSVNYGTSIARDALSSYAPESTKSLDSVTRNIGSYGSVFKNSKNLAPGETLVVKGEYSRTWLRLYLSSIITAVIILCGLLTVMTLILIQYRHRKVVDKKTSQIKEYTGVAHWFHLNYVLVGFGAAVLTAILIFVTNILRQSSLFYYTDYFFTIMTSLILLVGFFLTVFGPAIVVGIKDGFKGFIMVMSFTFLWLILLFFIYILIFQFNNQTIIEPYPASAPVYYENGLK